VTHHGHLVQCRLSVEHYVVVVLHVSLDLVADLKVKVARLRVEAEIHAVPVVSNDIYSARVLCGASVYQRRHSNKKQQKKLTNQATC